VNQDPLWAVVQAANEQIRSFAKHGSDHEVWEFFCECGCMTLLPITIAEFDGANSVLIEGHHPQGAARAPSLSSPGKP
jgi:hypothetical protein